MPELDPAFFLGDLDNGVEADLRRIEVGNFESDVDKILKHHFKWKGKQHYKKRTCNKNATSVISKN